MTDRDSTRAEPIFGRNSIRLEIAKLRQRVGEPRNRRLWQSGSVRKFLIAEQHLFGCKTAQDFESTRERSSKLLVALKFGKSVEHPAPSLLITSRPRHAPFVA